MQTVHWFWNNFPILYLFFFRGTPLQVSSYTHLLYKAQDPFSVCRQSTGSETTFPSCTCFFFGGLLYRSVLTPISCTKLKIHLVYADSPLVPKQLSHLVPVFFFGGLLYRSVLTPISCTKLKIHLVYADSPLVPKQLSHLVPVFLWDQVITSQIKKLRKRICWVEPSPLHPGNLLHKAQDTFSVCRQSKFQNNNFCVKPVFTSKIKNPSKRIWCNWLSYQG